MLLVEQALEFTNSKPHTENGISSTAMTYDLTCLFLEAEARLSESPQLHLYELAAELGVSCRTVETALRLGCGKTYRQLKKQKRLARARTLLKRPSLSRKEIAALVGYRSAEAFSRFVKSCTGKPPSRFRLPQDSR